jgi:hypothetical protein
VAALLALVAGLPVVGFACLGLAFAAKVYAAVLVVPAAVYVVGRSGWRRLAWCVGAFVGATVVVAAPLIAASPGGAWSSVRSQLERGLHIESLGASVLLIADRLGLYEATVASGSTAAKSRDVTGPAADALAFAGSALAVGAVVAVWLAFTRARPDPQRLAVAFAAGVAAVLAFGKVLSPQYAEWLLFLVPLAAGAPGMAAAALAGTAFLLAELWFHHYDRVFAVEATVWLVLLRNLALVACYGVLLSVLLRRGTVSR